MNVGFPADHRVSFEKAKAMFDIREDDLTSPQTRALLALHLSGMQVNSPAGHVFALDLSGLQASDVTVWTAWRAGEVAAVGALKMLSAEQAEIKSMRTHPDHLRQGAAAAILETIISTAIRRGVRQLSLETGSGEAFDGAVTLYRKRGFARGDAFGSYQQSAFNQFFHLRLDVEVQH